MMATPGGDDQQRQQEAAGGGGLPPRAVVIVPGYASTRRCTCACRSRSCGGACPAGSCPSSSTCGHPHSAARSIRPILDRIHDTVLSVALKSRALPPRHHDYPAAQGRDQQQQYGWSEFAKEMRHPAQGARPSVSSSFPPADVAFGPEDVRYRVALVGHSAGGWVSRIYLSDSSYDGMVYNGSRLVDTLVTLGSPHVFPSKLAGEETVPYALRNLKFVNEQCTGWEGGRVRCVCVGSDTVKAGSYLGGLFKDMAGSSYELCGFDEGGVVGDGITPLDSALGLPNATQLVIQGVLHGPEAEVKGGQWYGSDPGPLDQWIPYLLTPASSANKAAAAMAPAAAAAAALAGSSSTDRAGE